MPSYFLPKRPKRLKVFIKEQQGGTRRLFINEFIVHDSLFFVYAKHIFILCQLVVLITLLLLLDVSISHSYHVNNALSWVNFIAKREAKNSVLSNAS